MPPSVALLFWLVLLLGLLCFDPAKDPETSPALWVPLIWIFIVGSRLPSQWLNDRVGGAAQALEEGNTTDSAVYSVLILLAIGILMSRSFNWSGFFTRNPALIAFLCFALASVLWSDFPFVAFKRWFRDLGNYLVILVALSDPRPQEAVRSLLRRLFFLLITLSVLLVKYYPDIARHYDSWTGVPEYTGATTSKNMLGVLCLISGVFFFWDTATRWSERKERRTRWIILVNVVLIYWTLWLLDMSSSATSRLCLVLGCLVIAAAQSEWVKRRPVVLTALIPVGICLYLLLAFGLGIDINAAIAAAVGRDPTLTGRTNIWNAVLGTHTNPLVGVGYESFWLGPRLTRVWALAGSVNEAHNGYLEVYLNLGLVGLALLLGFLVASYRTICRRLSSSSGLGSLALAWWTILPFYNVTESAFKGQLMFVIFLLGAIVVPLAPSVRGLSSAEGSSTEKSPSDLQEVTTVRWRDWAGADSLPNSGRCDDWSVKP
jgi:exopolysaccharide production protein ExoQ